MLWALTIRVVNHQFWLTNPHFSRTRFTLPVIFWPRNGTRRRAAPRTGILRTLQVGRYIKKSATTAPRRGTGTKALRWCVSAPTGNCRGATIVLARRSATSSSAPPASAAAGNHAHDARTRRGAGPGAAWPPTEAMLPAVRTAAAVRTLRQNRDGRPRTEPRAAAPAFLRARAHRAAARRAGGPVIAAARARAAAGAFARS